MEGVLHTQEKRKSAKEGGLETGIENIRDKVTAITDMVNQIEFLQRVPSGYANLGEKVGLNEIPALDQFIEYRGSYDEMQKQTEVVLSEAYQALLKQLTSLRDMTGVHSKEEAMKFNKDTGRQEKDNL